MFHHPKLLTSRKSRTLTDGQDHHKMKPATVVKRLPLLRLIVRQPKINLCCASSCVVVVLHAAASPTAFHNAIPTLTNALIVRQYLVSSSPYMESKEMQAEEDVDEISQFL